MAQPVQIETQAKELGLAHLDGQAVPERKPLNVAYNLNSLLHLRVLSRDKMLGRHFHRNTGRYALALD